MTLLRGDVMPVEDKTDYQKEQWPILQQKIHFFLKKSYFGQTKDDILSSNK
jgi:hypothetical protein